MILIVREGGKTSLKLAESTKPGPMYALDFFLIKVLLEVADPASTILALR